MEEVIGRNGINAVLNLASLSKFIANYPPDDINLEFPFSTVSSLTQILEQVYGPHGGRGLALRVGRAC
ncbi:MAG: 4-vinyl reductase, partial [Chloroflexota bacterium]